MLVLFLFLSLLLVGIVALVLGADSREIRTGSEHPDHGLHPGLIVR